jgi:hypothetical protein
VVAVPSWLRRCTLSWTRSTRRARPCAPPKALACRGLRCLQGAFPSNESSDRGQTDLGDLCPATLFGSCHASRAGPAEGGHRPLQARSHAATSVRVRAPTAAHAMRGWFEVGRQARQLLLEYLPRAALRHTAPGFHQQSTTWSPVLSNSHMVVLHPACGTAPASVTCGGSCARVTRATAGLKPTLTPGLTPGT